MIRVRELRRAENGPQRVDHPRRIILTHTPDFMQDEVATWIGNGPNPRQIDSLRPCCGVAVLCHGDFLRRVDRTWRGAQSLRSAQALPWILRTSAGMIRQQGLNSTRFEFQNTAPHGVRFSKSEARIGFGCSSGMVQGDTVVIFATLRPEEQKPHGPEGYR